MGFINKKLNVGERIKNQVEKKPKSNVYSHKEYQKDLFSVDTVIYKVENTLKNYNREDEENRLNFLIKKEVYLYDDKETRDFFIVYHNVINELHFILLDAIRRQYKKAYNGGKGDYFAEDMEKCIKLCELDIQLTPEFIYYNNRYNGDMPFLPSFKRLCIIYDKRKDYQSIIDVCKKGLSIGIIPEDKEDLSKRLLKAQAKLEKTSK